VSKANPEQKCWDCGATNDTGAGACWLCHRRDWLSPGIALPSVGGASSGGSRRSTWDQFSKVDVAVLLGLFAIIIVPILAIISLWITLVRICSPWNR
jgi:hypothetical protein